MRVRPDYRALGILEKRASAEVRVVQELPRPAHRTRRDPGLLERACRLINTTLCDPGGDHLIELIDMDQACLKRRETGVGSTFAFSDGVAECDPLRVGADGHGEPLAGAARLVDAVRRHLRVAVADPRGHSATELVVHDLSAQDAGQRFDLRQLDALLAEWTRSRSADEIESILQAVSVPVHRATTTVDAFADAQLEHRQHFVMVEHPILGEVPIEAPRFHLSRTAPVTPLRPGPPFGLDNETVLRELLRMSEDEVMSAAVAGALE